MNAVLDIEPRMLSAARAAAAYEFARQAVYRASHISRTDSERSLTVHPYPRQPRGFLALIWNANNVIDMPVASCIEMGAVLEATNVPAAIREATELLIERMVMR